MTRNNEKIEVVTVVRSEESDLIRLNYEPGMSVSLVARQHGVAASQLFIWRKLDREGALTTVEAGESVVPASELAAARAQIAQLQRLPGNKTMENEILKEAVELARERKWIARSPLLDKDGQRSRSARLSGWRARMCMN